MTWYKDGDLRLRLIKYPSKKEVDAILGTDEPLMMLVSFDGDTIIISHLDVGFEHHILLAKVGIRETEIDKYFRVIFDRDGADWTFVVPENYCQIKDKTKRIETFYKNGFREISAALSALGYNVQIQIPKRYRRHFEMLN